MVQQASQSSPDVVVLLYESLLKAARGQQDDTSELSDLEQKIEKVSEVERLVILVARPTYTVLQAYGPDGLGILTVAGVPKFVELRQRLLPLSQAFAVCSTHHHTCMSSQCCTLFHP